MLGRSARRFFPLEGASDDKARTTIDSGRDDDSAFRALAAAGAFAIPRRRLPVGVRPALLSVRGDAAPSLLGLLRPLLWAADPEPPSSLLDVLRLLPWTVAVPPFRRLLRSVPSAAELPVLWILSAPAADHQPADLQHRVP